MSKKWIETNQDNVVQYIEKNYTGFTIESRGLTKMKITCPPSITDLNTLTSTLESKYHVSHCDLDIDSTENKGILVCWWDETKIIQPSIFSSLFSTRIIIIAIIAYLIIYNLDELKRFQQLVQQYLQ